MALSVCCSWVLELGSCHWCEEGRRRIRENWEKEKERGFGDEKGAWLTATGSISGVGERHCRELRDRKSVV